MMGYGYDASLSEGSLKPPVFLTSHVRFSRAPRTARTSSDYTSGRREPPAGEALPGSCTPLNNPNLEVLEDRLALWEGGEAGLVFLERDVGHRDHALDLSSAERRGPDEPAAVRRN